MVNGICVIVFYVLFLLLESNVVSETTPSTSISTSNEGFVLTLPGAILDVSTLVNKKKKFRNRGGREAALVAMRNLEEEGLGKLTVKKAKGSMKVQLHNIIYQLFAC